MRKKFMPAAVLAAVLPAVALGLSPDAWAVTNEELLRIIEQQNKQIEELSRRLENVERSGAATEIKAEEAVEKATQAQEKASDVEFKWGPAPTIMSKDGNWSFKVRGRLFADGGVLGDDDDI